MENWIIGVLAVLGVIALTRGDRYVQWGGAGRGIGEVRRVAFGGTLFAL